MSVATVMHKFRAADRAAGVTCVIVCEQASSAQNVAAGKDTRTTWSLNFIIAWTSIVEEVCADDTLQPESLQIGDPVVLGEGLEIRPEVLLVRHVAWGLWLIVGAVIWEFFRGVF